MVSAFTSKHSKLADVNRRGIRAVQRLALFITTNSINLLRVWKIGLREQLAKLSGALSVGAPTVLGMATLPNPLPRLTTDPSGRSLGLQLPPGRLVDAPDGEPLLWQSGRSASPGEWAALAGPAARLGLLPVLVDVGDGEGGPDTWPLTPHRMSYPGDHDPDDVLAESWERYGGYVSQDEEWPGLAGPPSDGTPGVRAADLCAAEVADSVLVDGPPDRGSWLGELRTALVPARRSADVPAVIGWHGPLNHEGDVGRLSAVLRS
jgi:hypothetical protein